VRGEVGRERVRGRVEKSAGRRVERCILDGGAAEAGWKTGADRIGSQGLSMQILR
jgi:hypothetical protein